MATEIERKFIVDQLPSAEVLGSGLEMRQGYLASEGDVEVRLRITADDATLTVKAGRGLSRIEIERGLDADEAESLWPHTAGRRIDKVRHRIAVGSHTAEVDVYAGALSGLLTVEVEFETTDIAARFEPPTWFGRELTGRTEWSNSALARDGLPPQ